MKLLDLFEKRRQDSPREKIEDLIKPYLGKDNVYISMVAIPKIGINPHTEHDKTPLAIYAYQLTDEIAEQLITDKLPYVSWEKYIAVIKSTNENQLSSDSVSSCEDAIHSLRKLMDGNKGWDEHTKSSAGPRLSFGKPSFPFFDLLSLTYSAARHLNNKTQDSRIPIRWNSILRKLGIESLRDEGTGSIYSVEPTQTAFLSTKTIHNYEIIRNSKSDIYKNEIRSAMQFYKICANPNYIPNNRLLEFMSTVITQGIIVSFDDDDQKYQSFNKDIRFERNRIREVLVQRGMLSQVENNEKYYMAGGILRKWLSGAKTAFYD